ncbi:MAG: pyrroline-5-carboxylate reductase [Ignavibacteriae bacterium]|nr:MAG: pyrroline-5-carboxylate reductase [Ignavibacteriota bacterium]
MNNKSVGFIGGGRITNIILQGWKRAGKLPQRILVTDTNAETLEKLKTGLPQIETVVHNVKIPAACDIVMIGVHPPVIGEVLQEIKSVVKPTTTVISLAPKVTIGKISELLGGLQNIARVNPNAPSIVNAGYDPVAFSRTMSTEAKNDVLELFLALGECPEVPEELLEAYALTTAMGPTYFWFQLYELQELAISFGISPDALKKGIPRMLDGALKTMYESGLTPAEVMDLVPVKPLGEEEETIKGHYRNRLSALYKKLKS